MTKMPLDTVVDNAQESAEFASQALWDEIEEKYWESIRSYREEEDVGLYASFHEKVNPLDVQLQDADEARSKLEEREAALVKELEAVRSEIAEKKRAISDINDQRREEARKFQAGAASRAQSRAQDDAGRRQWFVMARLKRIKMPKDDETEAVAPAPREPPSPAPAPAPAPVRHLPTKSETPAPVAPVAPVAQMDEDLEMPSPDSDHLMAEAPPAQAVTPPVQAVTPPVQLTAPPAQLPAPSVQPVAPPVQPVAAPAQPAVPPVQVDAPVSADPPAPQAATEPSEAKPILEPQPASSEPTSELSTPLSEPPLQLEAELDADDSVGHQDTDQTDQTDQARDAPSGIDVVGCSGDIAHRLRRIELENHWADEVISRPIRRAIRLRPGKEFTTDIIGSIYQPTDAKAARWLACEIQATGEEQAVPCQKCAKGTGPFQECVSLGTERLPRCGNCEWNKQSCSLVSESLDERGADGTSASHTPQGTGFTAVNSAPKDTADADDADTDEPPRHRTTARKSTSGTKKIPQPPKPETPAVGTPMSESPAAATLGPDDEGNLPEINKANLVLRDDGTVFTDPPCMRGVPLEKISPGHPYWEPDWPNVEEIVAPQLAKWKAKYEIHMANKASQSSKFLANRQINRGNAVLKFLADGKLHPYQIFGKQYVNKSLANYDTLYRLVQILEELEKFKIDITPSQWLRQRLCELCAEMGDDFSLPKTVHDLYHDPKVMALRSRSGFGNIGRPSGLRSGQTESSKKTSRSQKRKEPHVTPKGTPTKGTPKKLTMKMAEDEEAPPSPPPPVFHPRSSHRKSRGPANEQREASASQRSSTSTAKRARLAPSLPPSRQDLECDGYTSRDSFSHDHVMQVDWRIYQIKHRESSTNVKITQYWHFIDSDDPGSEEMMLEHQVLEDVLFGKRKSVKWGVYKEPIDFHLRFRELLEITYAPESLNIIIATRPVEGVDFRGDLMAQFKRERTKRRFLKFMESKGISLAKTSRAYIDEAWDKMNPEVLPSYSSGGED
ncbi:hypothetical protein B0T16DRAFT_173151 [Cercophora newfieldiana]|uniref:Uncharacterized protein n=1 Tax=Cercophora newfieldiana TaxID=92897 RepID=A0AA39Y853_9PEZI|nr:hypothetical protein B0T16DRAFT_173151 [Cercophora newfieldiana]